MNIKKRKSVCAVLISVWVFSLCGCVKKVDEAEFAGLDSIEVETVAEELGEPEAANGEADGAAVVGAESGEPEAVAGEGDASQEKPDTDMYIHVCGAVMQPGVYCMQPGERIYQAIEAAGGFAEDAVCAVSSHFGAAERQFRFPLELGTPKTPNSQYTVTGGAATCISRSQPKDCCLAVTEATIGRVVDAGITDADNMGAAMAPQAGILRPYQAA